VDAQSLAALYVEHAAGMRRLVFGILHDQEAADDIVQTAFARAADLVEEMAPLAFKAWLYRVAFNEAVTWKRRGSVAHKAARKLSERSGKEASQDPAAADALVRNETVAAVRQAMQGLSADEQQVVRARVYQDKTFAQIAADLGMPLGTVLTRMRRALEKLRRRLTDDD
jgi:RNA polymerase sigma-70 factor (ECF subfamily)